MAVSSYGYCPVCGRPGARRERRINGDDTCQAGHVYPSRTSLREPPATTSLPVATLKEIDTTLELLSLNIRQGDEDFQEGVKLAIARIRKTIAELLNRE